MIANSSRCRMLFLLLGTAFAACADAASPLSLSEQAALILRERCVSCHGADQGKGGLRLHTAEEALGSGALKPGDAAASELVRRITAVSPDERMPPKGAPLSAAQVETLTAWIEAGAVWDEDAMTRPMRPGASHWAFQRPEQAPPPTVQHASWARSPLDAFVLARMESAGLSPSPEAERGALLRRVSLDLTGLPPSPEELQAFALDHRPDAYERAVDRLLASPHYGERQAVRWLDIARYADTNGYEKDRHRSIWPYRDWVIRAFNADMPFDQFALEQLAGDLLPGATLEQQIATGFLRNSLYNEEGGVDVEEFRFEAMVDRVNATATGFLGLTVACAQCHDHKFDPISHREYFGFFGYLNNTDNVDLVLPDAGVEAARAAKQAEIAALIADMEARATPEGYAAWREATQAQCRDWKVLPPVAYASAKTATLNRLADDSVLVTGEFPNVDTYTVSFRWGEEAVEAIRLEALPDERLPGGGPGRGVIMSPDGDFFLSEVRLYAAPWNAPEQRRAIALSGASASFEAEGRGVALALDGQVDTGWGINGGQGKPHAAVFTLAEPLPAFEGGAVLTLELEHFYVHQHTLGRFRVSAAGGAETYAATGLTHEEEAALLQDTDTPALRRAYALRAEELREEQKRLAALEAAMPAPVTTLALQERAEPRETFLHHRGLFSAPTEPVAPHTPEVLHGFPENWPRNRLSFAQWIIADENPLFARVTVNRAWQMLFGRGLVETTEDFGLMASPPSHPELLDWMAVEFARRGYSMKELLRLIVTSSVYRQDSRATLEALEKDPVNVLLARAPRLRLDAELVRDAALAAGGLLSTKVGGPSVYPPIQPEVFASAYGGSEAMWPTSEGEDRYRRGLYTYVKRAAPYPTGATFDMPPRDTVCTRRSESNTPLQALTLLNNSEFFEAARAMAARVLLEAPGADAARLERASLLAVGRPADATETAVLLGFLAKQRARFASGAADPKPLVEGHAVEGVAPEDQAAWAAVCRVLLNLDEAISKT